MIHRYISKSQIENIINFSVNCPNTKPQERNATQKKKTLRYDERFIVTRSHKCGHNLCDSCIQMHIKDAWNACAACVDWAHSRSDLDFILSYYFYARFNSTIHLYFHGCQRFPQECREIKNQFCQHFENNPKNFDGQRDFFLVTYLFISGTSLLNT